MSENNKIIVVTMRCIDMVSMFSDNDRVLCDTCGEMTWLSSPWKGKKIDRIICNNCFKKEKDKFGEYTTSITEDCIEKAIGFAKDHYPTLSKKEIINGMIKDVEDQYGVKINVEKSGKNNKKK